MTKPAKNPKYLKPKEGLTATQRKSLGLPVTKAQPRPPGTATSPLICNAAVRETYRSGDGDQPVAIRPGSMVAHSLPSLGIGA